MLSKFKLTKKQEKKLIFLGVLVILCMVRAIYPETFDKLLNFNENTQAKNYDFCYPKSIVEVTDGDTIKFFINPKNRNGNGKYLKVRLIGIDSPEMEQKPFGQQSTNFLQELIDDSEAKEICCKEGREAKDKYRRTLADCWIGKTFLNAKMIEEGWALSYFVGKKNNKYKKLFLDLEEQAEEKELGLHNPNNLLTEAPYEWRKRKRSIAHRSFKEESEKAI